VKRTTNSYFIQVERLNSTGMTTISTITTPISVIQSVEPAGELTTAEDTGVGVKFAVAAMCNARFPRGGNEEAVIARNIPIPITRTGSENSKRFFFIAGEQKYII